MQAHLDTVAKVYEAFGKGDIPSILEALAEDVQWDAWQNHFGQNAGLPWLKFRKGHNEVLSFFQDLQANLSFQKFQVSNLMAGGNQVAATIDLDATVLRNGNVVHDDEIHLWTFNEQGKISHFRHYIDTAKHIAAWA